MKAAIAIFFSLVLVAAQGWAATGTLFCRPVAQRVCYACHCGAGSCCMAKTPDRAPVQPTVPTPSPAQNQLLSLLPALFAWPAEAAAVAPKAPPLPRAALPRAVPVYCRNCAFLI